MCSTSTNNRGLVSRSIYPYKRKNRICAESGSCSIIVEDKSSISCNTSLQMEGFSFEKVIEGSLHIISSEKESILKCISH